MRGVEMPQGAVSIARENRDRGVLMPLAIFAAEIIFECAVPGTKESQPVPASRTSVGVQSGSIGGCDDGKVKILSEVMGYPVRSVEPDSAHWARLGLPFPVHQ